MVVAVAESLVDRQLIVSCRECFFGNKNHDVKVVDPVEESVSEGLDSFGCWCSDNRVLVEFEP